MIRSFDFLCALLALVVLGPLLLIICMLLKLTGEGEIFYLQYRVGLGGKEFKLFKFATMLKNSPSLPGGNITKGNDSRILPLGHVLRKTKINELPQLLNILNGSMSLIGPRPMTKDNYSLYPPDVQCERAQVRPGLSGVGSIVFRNEEKLLSSVDDVKKYYSDTIAPYKAELEIWFCENRTVILHLKLILLTLISVARPSSFVLWDVFPSLPRPNNRLAADLIAKE